MSTVTGGFLAQLCENSHGLNADFCVGYILGAADQLQLAKIICRPASGASTLQTVEIVRQFIKSHPEEWNKHGIFLVEKPLVQAFPCSK
jgi:hypothetical protein